MAEFIQDGRAIDYTPVADVAAGEVIVQGDLIGVTKVPIPAEHAGTLAVEGVFDFDKEVEGGVTFAVGSIAYWDAVNNVAVTTDGSGANKPLGKVVREADDNDGTVRVRLCPCALPIPEGGGGDG